MRPRRLPRSRESPSQTENAIGRNSPGVNGGARGRAKGPLEDDRPFSLVVARDTRDIARVVGSDGPASLAGELKRIGPRQIEEPEIHRVLGVAEDEVGLAGARRHLRRNLDRDGVGELRRPARAGAAAGSAKGSAGCAGSSPPGSPGSGRRPPPPPAAREATARSLPSCPRSCRAIERGGRSTRHRRWPERSRRSWEDGTRVPAP